jgi:hypothetical protein
MWEGTMRLLANITMVVATLIAQTAIAQSPTVALSKLPQDMRDWVNRSCPRNLGPSLWSSCIVREASAASRGKPDLSRLSPDLQSWIIRSCPDSLGPSLAISCLTRESAALASPRLDISSLTEQQKQWLSNACPSSLGPILFVSCVQRKSAALRGTKSVPQQPSVDTSRAPRQRYGTTSRASSRDTYEIEVAHNDEFFVINGEKFEAQTYCLGWEEGDEVIFLDGSPYGACASATLLNLRTEEKCDVWCE